MNPEEIFRLETRRQEHHVPVFPTVPDFLQALGTGVIQAEAVILATPTSTHVPFGKLLLSAGVSLLIEKPFATSAAEGGELLEAAGKSAGGAGSGKRRAVVMVGHHRRHNPYVMAVKKVLDEGRLGRIVAVNGRE